VGINKMDIIKKFRVIIYLLISFLVASLFLGVYLTDNSYLKKISDYEILDKINVVKYEMAVESVKLIDEKYYYIDGWIVDKENYMNAEGSIYINNQVVLFDKADNVMYGINTVSVDRQDVSDLINKGMDYGKCGFLGNVKVGDLSPNKVYQIGVMTQSRDGKKQVIMSDEEITRK